jgi:hypothetical protein
VLRFAQIQKACWYLEGTDAAQCAGLRSVCGDVIGGGGGFHRSGLASNTTKYKETPYSVYARENRRGKSHISVDWWESLEITPAFSHFSE